MLSLFYLQTRQDIYRWLLIRMHRSYRGYYLICQIAMTERLYKFLLDLFNLPHLPDRREGAGQWPETAGLTN